MRYLRNNTPQSALKSASATALAAAVGLALSASATAATPDPYAMPNESWITLSGKVETVAPDRFTLAYRGGQVTVEMDDGDRDADAYKLMAGDDVTVTGRIDDDLFETTSIEASAVFVKNIDTTFFASAVDEEDRSLVATYVSVPLDSTYTAIEGSVAKVDGDEFVLDTGFSKIRVDVNDMPYDPLDDVGYQKIEAGDTVKVTGQFNDSLFDSLELEADSIVKLSSHNKSMDDGDNKSAQNN